MNQRTNEFLELYDSVQVPLFRYLCALLVEPEDARDVLQETNLALWLNFDQFESGTNFLSWARTIARYRVMQFRRMHRRAPLLLDESLLEKVAGSILDEHPDELARRTKTLSNCLQKLSDVDRELIRLRYIGGVTLEKVAEQLGRTVNGLSQSLRRIRGALRECVEREQGSLGN
ncbi:MAG: sigma-70 family RNA polymerase sigma factor [Planctomycetaceae bacterium]|nr:sigma-70 family RNA polymerase sigma factor [Planctomycetaceae bacterium]